MCGSGGIFDAKAAPGKKTGEQRLFKASGGNSGSFLLISLAGEFFAKRVCNIAYHVIK
jgi:hypothetical protein